jgi:hypothetical protein
LYLFSLPRIGRCAGPGLLFVLVIGVGACSIEHKDERPAGSTQPVTVAPDSLRRELVAPEQTRAGAPVDIVLRVTNITARPLDLSLQGRDIVFDVAVTNSRRQEVWRRLQGQAAQAILQLKTLAPNEALELRTTWNPRATDTGEHTISADIKTDGAPILFRPVRVRIE